ncbi:MAG: MarR family transcriptional regulator [Actinomycetota bacterium]
MASDTRWLDAEQLRAWISLAAFIEAVPASIDGQLRHDAGINRFEYHVLAMLSEEPDRSLTMSDLAQVAFGSLSRLSHAVSRLEGRGWVERTPGSSGRRRATVRLTEAGYETVVAAAPAHVAHVRSVLVEPLSDDELRVFGQLLRRVVRAADPALADHVDDLIPTIIERNDAAP